MCGAHLYNPEVYQTIPCGIPRVGVNAGSLNVTVRSWLLSLNKRGRGVSGQPPAEPARSQSGCLSRGQALADGRDHTQDTLLGARGHRLQWGFGKEPGRRGIWHPGVQAAQRVGCPRQVEAASPWRSHLTFPGLARRGRGEQMLLQVSCHPGLHEDIRALGPRPGPQPRVSLQDGYVTALITGTPHAPYWI